MAKRDKQTKKQTGFALKSTVRSQYSSNGEKVVWMFDEIDKDGEFAFDILRGDFQHKEFLDKMISCSSMTWNEVASQTHDEGKSKHHLLDYESLSKKAKDRIVALHLEQDTDRIFSFALQNKLRVIGLRENERFHVKWYDPEHEFCPSQKKHT